MMLIAKVMMRMLTFFRGKKLLAASAALRWGSRRLKSTAWSRASLTRRTQADQHRVVNRSDSPEEVIVSLREELTPVRRCPAIDDAPRPLLEMRRGRSGLRSRTVEKVLEGGNARGIRLSSTTGHGGSGAARVGVQICRLRSAARGRCLA